MNFRLVVRRSVVRMKKFGSNEGIAITEYGMLIALAALALIAVLAVFGPGISSWFASKTGQITTN
jgi:Flp pilus assembly pilin Flp